MNAVHFLCKKPSCDRGVVDLSKRASLEVSLLLYMIITYRREFQLYYEIIRIENVTGFVYRMRAFIMLIISVYAIQQLVACIDEDTRVAKDRIPTVQHTTAAATRQHRTKQKGKLCLEIRVVMFLTMHALQYYECEQCVVFPVRDRRCICLLLILSLQIYKVYEGK